MGKLEIAYIELTLENCDFIRVDSKDIGAFCCDDITNSISKIACNCIMKQQYCNEFFIEIKKSGNQLRKPFGILDEERVFDRITRWPDITAVDICYSNGEEERFYLLWDDLNAGGEINRFQTSFISERGDLYICVSARKTVHQIMAPDWAYIQSPTVF